jgi:hypothetical protein
MKPGLDPYTENLDMFFQVRNKEICNQLLLSDTIESNMRSFLDVECR